MTKMITAVEFILNSMERKLASGGTIDNSDLDFYKTHLRNYEDMQTIKAISFGMDLASKKINYDYNTYDSLLTQFYSETILK